LPHFHHPLDILPAKRNDFADYKLRHTSRVAEWTVEHADSAFGSVLEIDLVCSNTKAPDADEIPRMLQHVFTQFGF
jgi:hypothetical protein